MDTRLQTLFFHIARVVLHVDDQAEDWPEVLHNFFESKFARTVTPTAFGDKVRVELDGLVAGAAGIAGQLAATNKTLVDIPLFKASDSLRRLVLFGCLKIR